HRQSGPKLPVCTVHGASISRPAGHTGYEGGGAVRGVIPIRADVQRPDWLPRRAGAARTHQRRRMKMSGKKQVTVAEAVAAVNALVEKAKQAQQRDVLQEREVVGVYLTPLSPDGKSGGQVV